MLELRVVRFDVMKLRHARRPAVRREEDPKETSLVVAKLLMLWIIISTVVGSVIDWFIALSRSASDHPEPLFDFEWRTIASFAPLDERGEGLPKRRLQKLLGVSARSQMKLPW